MCCGIPRDPRSSFIHFITPAVSAKYLFTYLNYSLHALSPCKQENHSTLKTCPPFRPKKKKKTHPSFNSPKIPITSLRTTHRTSISDRPPDELHIPPDIEPKSDPRRHRFTARSHRAKTFPSSLTLAFHLCRHFQNRCMSRIITRRTPAL